jgi:hypothetical protein
MNAELLLIIFMLVLCLLSLVTTGLIAFRFVQQYQSLAGSNGQRDTNDCHCCT